MSKKFSVLALVMVSFTAVADPEQLTDDNVALLYESRVSVRAPDHKLAELISVDYRDARDEFTKQELFQKLKPVIKQKLNEAATVKQVSLGVRERLGDYDFDRKAFPTGLTKGAYFPYGAYIVEFINPDRAAYLPVDIEKAKSLAGHLRSGRTIHMNVVATIVGTKEEHIKFSGTKKALKLKINSIEVSLSSGAEVGKLQVQ